jgi:hypothetical protein
MKTITLRERTMLRFMNAVTDKPDWTKKVSYNPSPPLILPGCLIGF